MNRIPRDVVRDLWLLAESGEASAATRALVDSELAADPELARELAAGAGSTALPATPPPPPDAEREALERTRKRLSTRTQVFAMALLFTILPFTFAFEGTRVTFFLLRDAPVIAVTWWAVAAVMWGIYLRIRRQLSVPGL